MINWGILGLGNMGKEFLNCFAHPFQKILPEDWSLWSEGSVSFGRIGETGLSSAQDISALGITIGADKKIENNPGKDKIVLFFKIL